MLGLFTFSQRTAVIAGLAAAVGVAVSTASRAANDRTKAGPGMSAQMQLGGVALCIALKWVASWDYVVFYTGLTFLGSPIVHSNAARSHFPKSAAAS